MTPFRTATKLVLLAGLLALCGGPAAAQFGGGKRPEKKAPIVKADLPYIRCGTCEVMVKQAMNRVKKLREEQTPGKVVRSRDGVARRPAPLDLPRSPADLEASKASIGGPEGWSRPATC